jgi:hypothetical protein
MDKLFWLLPGELAGRAGPDREPWNLDSLWSGGIRAILSVNDGRIVHAADLKARGIAYACEPLSPNAPPRRGDDEICRVALPRAYNFVEGQLRDGRPVLVHCSSGKDRTGLFLCYFLVRRFGLSPERAMDRVCLVRPIALSAEGWREFATGLLAAVNT